MLTWDNPKTVSASGLSTLAANGTSSDISRVATRILINQDHLTFDDDTATWLPAGAGSGFWQGNQIELADFDGDGDDDLAITVAAGVDTSYHSVHALRILRNNNGSSDTFTDVTTSVLPALSSSNNDDFRGEAMRVRDVNGDGDLDIIVGMTESLFDSTMNQIRSTRLLLGNGTLNAGGFRLGNSFLPPASAVVGQASDLLLGDLAGSDEPALIFLHEGGPLQILPWND